MSKEEQAKYYELAKRERQVHMQLYPGWTARDNYAKHKKKRRRRDKVRAGSDEGTFIGCLHREVFFSSLWLSQSSNMGSVLLLRCVLICLFAFSQTY